MGQNIWFHRSAIVISLPPSPSSRASSSPSPPATLPTSAVESPYFRFRSMMGNMSVLARKCLMIGSRACSSQSRGGSDNGDRPLCRGGHNDVIDIRVAGHAEAASIPMDDQTAAHRAHVNLLATGQVFDLDRDVSFSRSGEYRNCYSLRDTQPDAGPRHD
jgi:hypothetical protein